jgi:AraC family transcriptional regulator, transcriptional activator of pobA
MLIQQQKYDHFSIHFNSFDGTKISPGKFKPFLNHFYGIIWFKKGDGSYFIDFKEYPSKENSIVLISRNQDVAFEFKDPSTEFIFLTFSDHVVRSSEYQVQKLLSFCIREHFEGKQVLMLNRNDESYLKNIVDQLYSVSLSFTGELRRSSIFHYLQLFLTYCVELTTQQKSDLLEGYTEVIGNFTSLLEDNFRSTQKVNFYTDSLNLTYNSLARYTSNYCKKTPKEIISERLVLEIKRLLSSTSKPIKEIAYQLGFDEPTNLVKYFKKYTGVTPSEFRKEK